MKARLRHAPSVRDDDDDDRLWKNQLVKKNLFLNKRQRMITTGVSFLILRALLCHCGLAPHSNSPIPITLHYWSFFSL